MSGPRPRFKGSAAHLAAALSPIVRPAGRSWVRYGESKQSQRAHVDPERIFEAHNVLSILHTFHDKLCFTKATLESVVNLLLEENKDDPAWKVLPEHKEQYVTALVARLQGLCRTVSQGQLKHPQCGWVRALPWAKAEAENTENTKAKAENTENTTLEQAEPAPNTFIYGWCKMHQLAWRCTSADKRNKVMAVSLEEPPGAIDSDSLVARWADGSSWAIADVTVGEYRARLAAKSNQGKGDLLWEGCHKNHNALKIVRRKDRNPILVLLEQKRQVCQILVHKCKSEGAALALLQEVAEQYAVGALEREELISRRDALMLAASSGETGEPKQDLMKKPVKAQPRAKKQEEKQEEEEEEQQSNQPEDEVGDFHIASPPSSADSYF